MELQQHIREEYGDVLGIKVPGDLTASPHDPTGKRFVAVAGDETKVIEARTVGGRNAGWSRGWVTLNAGDKRRIGAGRPAGYRSYTLMVGFAPDDEAIWWSALYDDDRLDGLEWESMDEGRWFRLAPDEAAGALIKIVDMFQQLLPMEGGEPAEDKAAMESRELVLRELESAVQMAHDHKSYDHLTAEQLEALGRGLVDGGLVLLGHALKRWRFQSYSEIKSKTARKK